MSLNQAEVNSKIRYNENLVSSYNSAINSINSQLSELYSLRAKVSSIQNSFGERQALRKARLSNTASKKYDVEMISSYFEGMYLLLNGTEYLKVYNGLSTAISEINAEIRRLESSRSYYVSQKAYRQGRTQYWQRQMRSIKD